jgi:peptidoglycan/xylan/chitin deacetylase (PgdA/CDA1 family)
VLSKAKRCVTESLLFPNFKNIRLAAPIVSFTFDDAPLSAGIVGAKILEQHGSMGTYYLSTGVMEKKGGKEPFIDFTLAKGLLDKGHDIQCHTKSHIPFGSVKSNQAIQDCKLNREALAKELGIDVEHFSYPLGQTGIFAKRYVSTNYKTARSVHGGINSGVVDVSHLRANPLYLHSYSLEKIEKLISSAIQHNAWLIFYTHEVVDEPSIYGITEDKLNEVVELCHRKIGNIMTIRDAFNKLT